jgi:uroporphyrinogen-III synthase
MSKYSILSTKKLPYNLRQFLLNADLLVVEADFISTRPIFFTMPAKSPMVFTSKNAVIAFLNHPQHIDFLGEQAYCVGQSTKHLLEQVGFRVIAAENASQLVDVLSKENLSRLTFFSGNLRLDILPEGIRKTEIEWVEVQVYETALSPVQIKNPLDGILFFSPSGVRSFLQLNSLSNQVCFCIGATTASELESLSNHIVIANHATAENVVAKCIHYFQQQKQVSNT